MLKSLPSLQKKFGSTSIFNYTVNGSVYNCIDSFYTVCVGKNNEIPIISVITGLYRFDGIPVIAGTYSGIPWPI